MISEEWSVDSPLDVSAKLLMTLMRLNIVKHKDSLPITLALFRKYGSKQANRRNARSKRLRETSVHNSTHKPIIGEDNEIV